MTAEPAWSNQSLLVPLAVNLWCLATIPTLWSPMMEPTKTIERNWSWFDFPVAAGLWARCNIEGVWSMSLDNAWRIFACLPYLPREISQAQLKVQSDKWCNDFPGKRRPIRKFRDNLAVWLNLSWWRRRGSYGRRELMMDRWKTPKRGKVHLGGRLSTLLYEFQLAVPRRKDDTMFSVLDIL